MSKKNIAVIGLKKNGLEDFFENILPIKKQLPVEFVPFIYCHKECDLYDNLTDNGYKAEDFDAAICVGGDGTFLYTSRVFAGKEIPIFAVNKGRCGFNTNIEVDDLESYINDFLQGRVKYSYKSLLDINIEDHQKNYLVLNDGVISHTGISRMVRLKVNVGRYSVYDYRGDGVIISSPTGSTAYNLSAGGPILHPSVDAFVVCPICPHTLAIRPYIIPFNETITVKILESSGEPQLTLDGQKIVLLKVGQKIIIKKSEKRVKIIKTNVSFSEILEKKLGWKV